MISRRRFLRDMLGVVVGAGVVGLPVWDRVSERRPVSRFRRPMMGTDVEIVLVDLDQKTAAATAQRAFATMEATANGLTIFDPASALNALTASAGTGPVRVAGDVEAVLSQAVTMQIRTEGAFTPAIGPLSKLWSPSRSQIPQRNVIERAKDAVNRADVKLPRSGYAELTATTGLDLGGIAKGYAVDQAVRVLRTSGVSSAMVNAGGDLRLLGSRDGQPWRVGIPDPAHPERIAKILYLRDAAVATSGDYERFFVVDGVRYHHIVDPRSGYPATGTRSFTVVLPDGISADAAATAGFVLGPRVGPEFVTRIGGTALAADSSGEWIRTNGLADRST